MMLKLARTPLLLVILLLGLNHASNAHSQSASQPMNSDLLNRSIANANLALSLKLLDQSPTRRSIAAAEQELDFLSTLPSERVRVRLRVTNQTTVTMAGILDVTAQGADNCPLRLQRVNHAAGGTVSLPSLALASDWTSLDPGEAEELTYQATSLVLDGRFVEHHCALTAYAYVRPLTATATLSDEIDLRVYLDSLRFVSPVVSQPVTISLAARDVGDAPASNNHFALAMSAYLNVPAAFPTVFETFTIAQGTTALGTTTQGPIHHAGYQLHLGQRYSHEIDADLLPDADRVRNVEVASGEANRDYGDDGLDLSHINFTHCERANFPVRFTITPQAIAFFTATQPAKSAYLNLWVDGNRNGQWADVIGCPNGEQAREHIVIDAPIDIGLVEAGTNALTLFSNPVYWPDELTNASAWLRLTLSEQPSVKTALDGDVAYGDGRGPAQGFSLGETEDYLWQPRNNADKPNLSVTVEPALSYEYVESQQVVRPLLKWIIRYQNLGAAAANEVLLSANLAGFDGESDVKILNFPPDNASVFDGVRYFNIGTLEAGDEGVIVLWLLALLEQAQPPTELLTADLSITSNVDSDVSDNQAFASATVPLSAPLITWPSNGTTSQSALIIQGVATPSSTVQLFVDEQLTATLTATLSGTWQFPLTLVSGTHTLHTISTLGSQTSFAPGVLLIVDDRLSFDPLSLRVIDSKGRSQHPTDALGRTDRTGWRVSLLPSSPITLALRSTCLQANPQFTIRLQHDATEISGVLTDPDGDDLYTSTLNGAAFVTLGEQWLVKLSARCGLSEQTYAGTAIVESDGVVFDMLTHQPLATTPIFALISLASDRGPATLVKWISNDPLQKNPQLSAADGTFGFLPPAGRYQLLVTQPGYQTYRSSERTVINTPFRIPLALTPSIDKQATVTVTITATGFNLPVSRIGQGDTIVWVNLDRNSHRVVGESGFDSGILETGESYKFTLNQSGSFSYADTENPLNTGTILVGVSGLQKNVYLPLIIQ